MCISQNILNTCMNKCQSPGSRNSLLERPGATSQKLIRKSPYKGKCLIRENSFIKGIPCPYKGKSLIKGIPCEWKSLVKGNPL